MSCYYPNGDLSTDGDIPCDTSGYGPCCPLNWECESNGLYYLANEGYYGRYTCTDQTWQSSNCPQICTHDLTAAGNEAVLECTSGSYCCDSNRPELSGGTACCEAGTSRFSLAALPLLPPYNDGDNGDSVPSAVPSPMPAAAPSSMSGTVLSSSTPPPATPPSILPFSAATQTSNTPPPSSTSPSDTPTPSFLTSFTPLSSSTAHFTTPISTSQTISTSTTPTKVPSSSSLSTAGSSSPSIRVIMQIVTSDGSQSTIISSTASNGTAPPSTLATTKHSRVGRDIGIAFGVFIPLAAIASFLLYWRRKRSRRSTSTPGILQVNFKPAEPKSSASSSFPHTPSTAPPDSHRSSTLVGSQTQQPQSAELQGSPTVGTFGNSRGLGITRSAGTGASTSPRQSELPAMREVGGGNTNAAELPGTTSPYKPYRPPGWS